MTNEGQTSAAMREVVRSPSMPRLAIDSAIFGFLGRDVEGSLLAISNDIDRISDVSGELANIVAETRMQEVARVRMAPDTAFLLLRNLYLLLITSGLISQEAMTAGLADMDQRILDMTNADGHP